MTGMTGQGPPIDVFDVQDDMVRSHPGLCTLDLSQDTVVLLL